LVSVWVTWVLTVASLRKRSAAMSGVAVAVGDQAQDIELAA